MQKMNASKVQGTHWYSHFFSSLNCMKMRKWNESVKNKSNRPSETHVWWIFRMKKKKNNLNICIHWVHALIARNDLCQWILLNSIKLALNASRASNEKMFSVCENCCEDFIKELEKETEYQVRFSRSIYHLWLTVWKNGLIVVK